MTPGDAARAYVEKRGWPVFPREGRRPLTRHGHKDASTDIKVIEDWWRRWPTALIGCPTGAASGLVVLDIDRKGGVDGFDTLETLGVADLPSTPMAHTPHDGLHVYFARNHGFVIYSSIGKHGLGPGIDIRGEGGSITLPSPGTGYRWDELLNLRSTPLKTAPSWLGHRTRSLYSPAGDFSLPPMDLLLHACRLIREAGIGERHDVLNARAFFVGTLVGRGILDEGTARQHLTDACLHMVVATGRDPKETQYDLAHAFRDGVTNARNERTRQR